MGGMKCPWGLEAVTQLVRENEGAARTTNRMMTINLTATMASFSRDDSQMPMVRRIVAATTMATAGTFRIAPVVDQLWLPASKASGAETNCAGISMPKSRAKLTT